MIVGFMMWVYAWSEFGLVVSVGSLVVPIAAAVLARRVLTTRDLLIAVWSTGCGRSGLRTLGVSGGRYRMIA